MMMMIIMTVVASQNRIIVHKGQQLSTRGYNWTESMKRHSPHLKLYANLPQIQTLNPMTAPAFAALLRVQQHNHRNE